jgi:hypothetical protein
MVDVVQLFDTPHFRQANLSIASRFLRQRKAPVNFARRETTFLWQQKVSAVPQEDAAAQPEVYFASVYLLIYKAIC